MRTVTHSEEEKTRLALELYQRDQEEFQTRLATEAALEEASVPAEYLERAERELNRRRQQSQAQRTRYVAMFAAMAVGIVMVLAIFLISANRPASPPVLETFAASAETNWTLDVNPESQARVSFEGGITRMDVDRLAGANYFATLRRMGTGLDVRTLRTVTFRARGEGIPKLRLRFVNGADSWVTPPVTLTSGWTDYRVPLDGLNHFQRSGGGYKSDGRFNDRVADRIDEIQIQVGQHVNDRAATGWIEFDELEIRP
jgi:hypothetical protein